MLRYMLLVDPVPLVVTVSSTLFLLFIYSCMHTHTLTGTIIILKVHLSIRLCVLAVGHGKRIDPGAKSSVSLHSWSLILQLVAH